MDANPWAELFQEQINFRFSYNPKTDTSPVIINQHPPPGNSVSTLTIASDLNTTPSGPSPINPISTARATSF